MPLTPANLVFLIELTEIEIVRLDSIVNDEGATVELRDECADTLVLASITAGALQEEYESHWQEGSNLTPYDVIIERIAKRAA